MVSKKLSLSEMESYEGGRSINGCDIAGGLAVTIWAVGLGMAWTGVGAAVGFLGGLAVTYVCSPNS